MTRAYVELRSSFAVVPEVDSDFGYNFAVKTRGHRIGCNIRCVSRTYSPPSLEPYEQLPVRCSVLD